jgi:hypothetical protein
MTTLSAWKFSTLQDAGEAPAKLERACEHAVRP